MSKIYKIGKKREILDTKEYFDCMSASEFQKQHKVIKKRNKPEEILQKTCIEWFDRQYPSHTRWVEIKEKGKWKVKRVSLLCSNNNGGYRNKIEAINLSKAGTSVGYADVTLYINPVVCFEFKATTKQSECQKVFQMLIEKHRIFYFIIRTFEEFKTIIERFTPEK